MFIAKYLKCGFSKIQNSALPGIGEQKNNNSCAAAALLMNKETLQLSLRCFCTLGLIKFQFEITQDDPFSSFTIHNMGDRILLHRLSSPVIIKKISKTTTIKHYDYQQTNGCTN